MRCGSNIVKELAAKTSNSLISSRIDIIGEMVGTSLCRSGKLSQAQGKLSQSVKYSQKRNSESKLASTHRYMSPSN